MTVLLTAMPLQNAAGLQILQGRSALSRCVARNGGFVAPRPSFAMINARATVSYTPLSHRARVRLLLLTELLGTMKAGMSYLFHL